MPCIIRDDVFRHVFLQVFIYMRSSSPPFPLLPNLHQFNLHVPAYRLLLSSFSLGFWGLYSVCRTMLKNFIGWRLEGRPGSLCWSRGCCLNCVYFQLWDMDINVWVYFFQRDVMQVYLFFHIKNPTRSNSVSKFYFRFIWSSTCFGRHTVHHQELKIALAASGVAYVEGCWTFSCWTLTESSNYRPNNLPRMKNQRLLVQF